jgi:nitrogen permease regulator 3-like protein
MSISALYATLQRTSSLANAIATAYDGISRSMIASATLTPCAPISLQIPPATSTSVLPSSTEPPSARTQPGVWLTTATTDNLEEVASLDPAHSAMSLAKHFTLLLLDNESKILADISQSGGPLAAALAHYIRVSSPTKSFAKISALHSVPLADIQVLAKHLVDWRRARAIPPLHQRDVYIVSPNADMRKLSSAVKAYESTFPTLPSLPKMLQALSGTPRPYSSLIPSKDHKDRYFMILAWMLRGGWVTQLRTFAVVRVDSSVKTAVKEHTKAERNGTARADKSNSMEASHDTIMPLNPSQRPSIISRVSSDVKSSTSSHTNIRMNSLVLQPARASPMESKWLEYIGDHLQDLVSADLPEDEVVELQRYWPAFTRYLNGLEALEKIPVREGLKRRLVWDLFLKMGLFEPLANEAESKKDTHQRIFVVFQHW